MQAVVVVVVVVVVVHPKIGTEKQLFDVRKNLSGLAYIHTGWLHFHTQNMAFYCLPFKPKKEALQQSDTHTVTSAVKRT